MTTPERPVTGTRTWFEKRTTLERVCGHFAAATSEIRIASGFFTIRGWGLIRRATAGKRVFILVGLDDPGEDRARMALVYEIMRDLSVGVYDDRRQAVVDLVLRIETGQIRMVDARAFDHHAKLYIVDQAIAIVASANATGRGFVEQIEAGTVRDDPADVAYLVAQYDGYFAQARDITQDLLDALKGWLVLAQPWDVYLKAMLALEDLRPTARRYKRPVSYQVDMIAQALRQIRAYGGAMLVASTGLGKTVVATHVALQLLEAGEITNALVIGPKVVRESWRREMRLAAVPFDYFVHQALDKGGPRYDSSLREFTEIAASLDAAWLLIVDESHVYRKRYGARGGERGAFTRLLPIARANRAKMLLLTGSPYSTDVENINDQLLLLPRTGPQRALFDLDDARAWRIDSPEAFIELPVGSQLTTPHVAKYYGREDEHGVYVDFDGEKRYIPHVTLFRVDVPLALEDALVRVLASRALEVRTGDPRTRHSIEGQARVAWSSSPAAIADLIQSVLDTPGGPRAYKVTFRTSLPERRQLLQPLLERLGALDRARDTKLAVLVQYLETLRASGRKAIVFCERLATVVYLEQALGDLLPQVRVYGTVAQRASGVYEHKPQGQVQEAFEIFAPIANHAQGKHARTYDVFISTDAHGVGVNLQDASVVINYDIDWTPIDPVQRAGRVLRPWHEPRTVEIYTFVPHVSSAAGRSLDADLVPIRQRWARLVDRHGQSQKLIDLPVLPTGEKHDIRLAEIAPQVTIEAGRLDLEAVADQDISPYYRHTSHLQTHRAYAATIRDDIVSALVYPGAHPLVFVLLRYAGRIYWPVYDVQTRAFVPMTDVQALDLIACSPTTPTAFVDVDVVEQLADACIRAWAAAQGAPASAIMRVATLYLKPERDMDQARDMFSGAMGAGAGQR